jgi:hypothetical protein
MHFLMGIILRAHNVGEHIKECHFRSIVSDDLCRVLGLQLVEGVLHTCALRPGPIVSVCKVIKFSKYARLPCISEVVEVADFCAAELDGGSACESRRPWRYGGDIVKRRRIAHGDEVAVIPFSLCLCVMTVSWSM